MLIVLHLFKYYGRQMANRGIWDASWIMKRAGVSICDWHEVEKPAQVSVCGRDRCFTVWSVN